MMLLVVGEEMNTTVPFLKEAGYECVTAPGVLHAISAVTQSRPDLVITEFRLPDGVGFEIIRHVRQVSPKTPVILASEDLVPEMEGASLMVGAAAYLRKPVTFEALTSAIESVVKDSSL